MKIDKIKKTKSGKYKIYTEDRVITTYDDVLINTGLLYNKNIDDSIIEKIELENKYYDVYNKTLSYIVKHQRTKDEIIKYISKYELLDSDSNKILNKLEEIGLINDLNYTKAFISDSINLSNKGPLKIKNELIKHGVDEDIVENEINKIDNQIILDKIDKIINKKINSNHKYSSYQIKQKIIVDMVNLGYKKDDILSIINNYSFDDSLNLEKDFDKLYSKLSKKIDSYELINKIRQKLYSKGYDINKINYLIEKKSDD